MKSKTPRTADDDLAMAGFSVRDYPFSLMHKIVYQNNLALGAALKQWRLTPAIWRIIAILQEYDGMHVGRLSQEAVIDRTLLSRVIADLERRKLVRRQPDPTDKRFTSVSLTPSGRKMFDTILPIGRGRILAGLAGIDESDLRRLREILGRVAENFGVRE
jgi:DNA-binding MarR family transcriptional regulator